MKTQLMKGASILTAVIMLSMVFSSVLAAPPLPFERYGTAAGVNNAYISSWIDGVEYGNCTTSGAGAYSIDTVGDDTVPDTIKTGGVNPDQIQYARTSLMGATARFFTQTDTFVIGGSTNGALTQEGADTTLLKISTVVSQGTAGITDYIILFNPHTSAAPTITSYSLQVGAAAAQAIALSDIPTTFISKWNVNPIPATGANSYLVINMAKWGGLDNTGTSVKVLYGTHVVDRVEYGNIASATQNTIMSNAQNPTSGQEIYRTPTSGTDTNQCAADFAMRAATDIIAPKITNTVPADGAINVLINQNVVITFSEPIATGSFVLGTSFTIAPNPGGLGVAWSGGNTIATVSHTAFAYSTPYTCTVTNAVTDVAGNPLLAGAVPNPWSFTTEAPPAASTATITNVLPASPTTDNTPAFSYSVTNAPTSAEFYRSTTAVGGYALFGTDTPADGSWTSGVIPDGIWYFAARGIGATSEAVPNTSEWGPYTIDTTNPVANAGADMIINTPTQKNDATATDATSGVATTVWTFPANVICSNINILNPTFSASVTGVYTVTLTVTDNVGLFHQDTFQLDYTVLVGGVTPWDISCHKSGNDILIDWTTGAGPFDVYIADTVTGAGPYVLLQAGVAGNSYTHVGALTDGLSHSYYITADGGATKSNLGFKLRLTLADNLLALNWISLPYKCDIVDANGLMDDINADGPPGNVVNIATRWNTVTQGFESRTQVTAVVRAGLNFAVTPGAGYQVKLYAGMATTWNIVGAAQNKDASYVPVPITLPLADNLLALNWISLPYNTVIADANGIMDTINAAGPAGNNVNIATRWNTVTQGFESRTQVTAVVRAGLNFAVTPGAGFQVKLYSGSAFTWTISDNVLNP